MGNKEIGQNWKKDSHSFPNILTGGFSFHRIPNQLKNQKGKEQKSKNHAGFRESMGQKSRKSPYSFFLFHYKL